MGLINEVQTILYLAETFEEWKAKQLTQEADQNALSILPTPIPYNADAGLPKFDQHPASDFLKIMKSYFSEEDQTQLSALIYDHIIKGVSVHGKSSNIQPSKGKRKFSSSFLQ